MDAIALLFALEKSKRPRKRGGKVEIRHVGENVAGCWMMTHSWGCCCMCVKSIDPQNFERMQGASLSLTREIERLGMQEERTENGENSFS